MICRKIASMEFCDTLAVMQICTMQIDECAIRCDELQYLFVQANAERCDMWCVEVVEFWEPELHKYRARCTNTYNSCM